MAIIKKIIAKIYRIIAIIAKIIAIICFNSYTAAMEKLWNNGGKVRLFMSENNVFQHRNGEKRKKCLTLQALYNKTTIKGVILIMHNS